MPTTCRSLFVNRFARGMGSIMWLAWMMFISCSCNAQVDGGALQELRTGLRRLRQFKHAVSARITETIEIVGKSPLPEEPLTQDPELKGQATYYTWGDVPSRRAYHWLWAGDRWKTNETRPIGDAGESSSTTWCDGHLTSDLTLQVGHPATAQGSIDRPRGTAPTPATFAYMPSCRWAEDMLASMRLSAVRRVPAPDGKEYIECIGTERGRYTRLVFDPARRYAIVEYAADGDRSGSVERVTQWKEVNGFHVPIAMEQEMRSGPSCSAPIWRIMRLTLSDVRVGPVDNEQFKPQWPEGTQIVNVPEGKMYRYVNGQMQFVMYLGGRTPARMLMGWGVIGGVVLLGLALLYALVRRRVLR